MTGREFQTVEEYIAGQPEPVRPVLEQLRGIVRAAAPGAEEKISYKIPAYMVQGNPVLYFAGWKRHVSLYPATGTVVAKFGDEIAPYLAKSTLKFPLSQPLPVDLIERVAAFRAAEAAFRPIAKSASIQRR
jgi:uncharacterized protein YdhG (YjbR/CyaY superfamily)